MKRRSLLAAMSGAVVPLPEGKLFAAAPETYWKRLREEQFLLPEWRAYMNNGSLGVAPRPVLAAVEEYLAKGAAMTGPEYPRWGYEVMESHRREAAEFLGCSFENLAITHNATEAMSLVAQGLDLSAGDEVLMTDQEHTGGKGAWLMREARHGISVRTVAIPLPPRDSAELVERVVGAIGPRTRVLSFSGILTTTGLVMPVREICRAARAKGVITVVDGAHMHGQIPFQIGDLECDFLAGSPHKWLFAPPGCGLLYIREEMLDRLWPLVTTEAFTARQLKAARFMQVGTNSRAVVEGMGAGIRFARAIGPERIYGRIHELGRRARGRAAAIPELELLTPEAEGMYGGLVAFRIPPAIFDRFSKRAAAERMWIYGSNLMRIATHIHTRPQDVDRFFDLLGDSRRSA
jgi:isopenicillin-N epimerase